MGFLSGIWAKVLAAGAIVLGFLLALLAALGRAEKAGENKAKSEAADEVLDDIKVFLSYDEADLIVELSLKCHGINVENLSIAKHGLLIEEQAFSVGIANMAKEALPDKYSVKKEDDVWHVKLSFFS